MESSLKSEDQFILDLVKITKVLPHVPVKSLLSELRTVSQEENRVLTVLRKYFSTYKENENILSLVEDLKIIRCVLPSNYPVVKLCQDLNIEKLKQNRVQLVLKKYFENEKSSLKRASDESIVCLPEKKHKTNGYKEPERTEKLDTAIDAIETSLSDILKNLFPNLPSSFTKDICKNLNIDINEVPDNDTLNAIVSLITNRDIDISVHENNDVNENIINKTQAINVPTNTSSVVQASQESSATEEYTPEEIETLNAISSENKDGKVYVPFETLYDFQTDPYLPNTSKTNEKTFFALTDVILKQPKLKNTYEIENCKQVKTLPYTETSATLEAQFKSENEASKLNSDDQSEKYGSLASFLTEYKCDNVDNWIPAEVGEKVKCMYTSVKPNGKTATLKRKSQNFTNPVQPLKKTLPVNSVINAPMVNATNHDNVNNWLNTLEPMFKTDTNKSELDTIQRVNRKSVTFCETAIVMPEPKIPDIDGVFKELYKQEKKFQQQYDVLEMQIINLETVLKPNETVTTSELPKIADAVQEIENNIILNPYSKVLKTASVQKLIPEPLHDENSNSLSSQDDVIIVYDSEPSSSQSTESKNRKANSAESSKKNQMPIDLTLPSCSKDNTDVQENNSEHKYFYNLMEMFPDISPTYLRKFCDDRKNEELDDLITLLLDGDYEQRIRAASPEVACDFDEQFKLLLDLFPNADPTYLQRSCERLSNKPTEFKEFVEQSLVHKDYPTKEAYLKKLELSAQFKQYTSEFDVKKYLEIIPDPVTFFNDPKRKSPLSSLNTHFHTDHSYASTFLKNYYCSLPIRLINLTFSKVNFSIIQAASTLETAPSSLKTKRRPYPLPVCNNVPLLQEIAFVEHKSEILAYIKKQEEAKSEARKNALNLGLMKTCGCCFDDEVMPEDTVTCEDGHLFCKDCVKKGCEVTIGQGKLAFPCLTDCQSHFSLQVLQSVLAPKVFSKMAQRKQLEEVKAAGIEELEFCPFCDFATIPAPGDKVFRCLNNECMKESCRQCKEPSHIPLRCDEVEKENEVKIRTYIEDKMTEALVRICYKCGMKFVKADGCNKMTCSCGAMMCYICNQPVKDYKHFNGMGGEQYELCPLYSDTVQLHAEAVKRGAQLAKQQLGIGSGSGSGSSSSSSAAAVATLKHDPAQDIDTHYNQLAQPTPQRIVGNVHILQPQVVIHLPPQQHHARHHRHP